MFPLSVKQSLFLAMFFVASTTFSQASPLPAYNSSQISPDSDAVTLVATDEASEHPISPVPSTSEDPPANPRAAIEPVEYSRRVFLWGEHKPVGYVYIPMNKALEYDKNKQPISLSDLVIPGIPENPPTYLGHFATDGYLLQNFFQDSVLPTKVYCPCIVFTKWSKGLPETLSEFSTTHNGDKSEIYEYRHTIAFFNGIVPTSNRENPDTFVRRIRRRTLRLPSSCTSEPENYKLYTNCPLPDKGGVFKIPSSWVSAEWHTWSPEDPWLKKAFKEDKSRNH
ncbi:hypothetical protein FB446DRAFT_759967 [Lentinula raphanica]|nr:hypothetical protein FB446DRAFT_759967 [Lentinula raphanica]